MWQHTYLKSKVTWKTNVRCGECVLYGEWSRSSQIKVRRAKHFMGVIVTYIKSQIHENNSCWKNISIHWLNTYLSLWWLILCYPYLAQEVFLSQLHHLIPVLLWIGIFLYHWQPIRPSTLLSVETLQGLWIYFLSSRHMQITALHNYSTCLLNALYLLE